MLIVVTPRALEGTVEQLLRIEDLAAMLQTTPQAIHTQRHRGVGPKGVRVGKRVLYRPADVAAWLEERAERD